MKEESESAEDQTISEEEQEDVDYEVELRIPRNQAARHLRRKC